MSLMTTLLGLDPLPKPAPRTRNKGGGSFVRTDKSPNERKLEIRTLLLDLGVMTKSELAQEIGASTDTIEKDTLEMIDAGDLKARTYRGVYLYYLPVMMEN